MIVSNNGEFSSIFKTLVGVRQGGAASPKLFSIYINRLINKLVNSNQGLIFGKIKFDTLVYADDILIMNTTKRGLQTQLEILEKFGYEFDIKYNPTKTNKEIKRDSTSNIQDIWQQELKLCGENIEEVEQMRYLGFELDNSDKNNKHLAKLKQKAYSSLSKLNILGINTDYLSPFMKGQLFKVYIRPMLYYGTENMYFNKSKMNIIKRIDGNILKKMMMVPTRCRSSSLLLALNITPVQDHIIQSKFDFYLRLLKNPFTKLVLEETGVTTLAQDLNTEINEIVDSFDYELVKYQPDLPKKIEAIKYIIKVNSEADKFNNEEYNEVKRILHSKNRQEIPKKLFSIIKFK